jgi:REP element-mobilizing transposase RayT
MTYDPDIHHRRSIRLKGYDYSRAGAYFITICTHGRECLLGDVVDGEMRSNEYGDIVCDEWLKLPKRYPDIKLDAFGVMPNHTHAIITIHAVVGAIHELPLRNDTKHRRTMLIPKIVGYVKTNTAKRINLSRNTHGTRVWQRNYHEHVIRDETDLSRIREYIVNNPRKWDMDSENPYNTEPRRHRPPQANDPKQKDS